MKVMQFMVLIFDDHSEIGAQVSRNVCFVTCVRHLIRSRAVTNPGFYPIKPVFLHACAPIFELPMALYSIAPQ